MAVQRPISITKTTDVPLVEICLDGTGLVKVGSMQVHYVDGRLGFIDVK